MRTILLMTLLSAFLVAGQIAFKKAVAGFEGGLSFTTLLHFALQPLLWLAILCIGAGTLVWGYVLSYESLSRVYPLVSISYVLMAIVAHFWLGEPLTATKMVGTALIVGGIAVLFS
jgi:drug/metabolite transporter (DMT)-like permease